MDNLARYFWENTYHPRWFIGDRVQGRWHGIPFRGSVANDSEVSTIQGPRASVFLDLPIVHNGRVIDILWLSPKDLKPLV